MVEIRCDECGNLLATCDEETRVEDGAFTIKCRKCKGLKIVQGLVRSVSSNT